MHLSRMTFLFHLVDLQRGHLVGVSDLALHE
jgi:hypothetical protein